MKRKLSIITILLATLSLTTLGFSAWIINSTNTEQVSSNVSVGAIEQNSLNLLSENLSKTKTFEICKDGIVFDETIVNEASLIFGIDIDVTKALNCSFIKENNIISYKTTLISVDLQDVFVDQIFVGGEFFMEGNSSLLNEVVSTTNEGKDSFTANIDIALDASKTTQTFELRYKFSDSIAPKIKEFGTKDPVFKMRLLNI